LIFLKNIVDSQQSYMENQQKVVLKTITRVQIDILDINNV